MRTTISLDDDILLAVQERAHREKRTAGDVLSELARLALTGNLSRRRTAGPSGTGFGHSRAEALRSPTL